MAYPFAPPPQAMGDTASAGRIIGSKQRCVQPTRKDTEGFQRLVVLSRQFAGRIEMQHSGYPIEKYTDGWPIRMSGIAILICQRRKTAVSAARRGKPLGARGAADLDRVIISTSQRANGSSQMQKISFSPF
jgi:hypothetical protein